MSHMIGQPKQDNQQLNPDSDQPEPSTLSSTPKLSDADYEFLFNQLLEGIAHGWHDRRIVKFFQQLGDRGQQAGWIDWLNREKVKLLKLPIQSKRYLGTTMIRLGELTQSATEVNQIGSASYRIGRELLFGNTTAVVWEYAGPDLTLEVGTSEVATEQELSARLPIDFTALGSVTAEPEVSESANSSIPQDEIRELVTPMSSDADIGTISENKTEHSSKQVEAISDLEANQDLSPEERMDADITSESESATGLSNNHSDSANFTEKSSYDEKSEFEPSKQILDEAITKLKDLSQTGNPETALEVEQQIAENLEITGENSKLEVSDTLDALDDDVIDRSLSLENTKNNLTTIDLEQVMHLIQSDEKLAQQISQKLNITGIQAEPVITAAENPLSGSIDELDKSSLELVESWFNLGLKHVSTGEFAKAIADWEKALNINPNLPEAWHNRGSALGRLGKYEEAVESFQNALTIDPNNSQAWNDRAHALYQLQEWSEAINSWSNAIKIMPGNHLFWYNRGCALEQLEKWQDAISSYEKALEIKPDFQPGRSRYINLVADSSGVN